MNLPLVNNRQSPRVSLTHTLVVVTLLLFSHVALTGPDSKLPDYRGNAPVIGEALQPDSIEILYIETDDDSPLNDRSVARYWSAGGVALVLKTLDFRRHELVPAFRQIDYRNRRGYTLEHDGDEIRNYKPRYSNVNKNPSANKLIGAVPFRDKLVAGANGKSLVVDLR